MFPFITYRFQYNTYAVCTWYARYLPRRYSMEPPRRQLWRRAILRIFTVFTVVIGIVVDRAVEAADLQRVSCDYVCKVKKSS